MKRLAGHTNLYPLAQLAVTFAAGVLLAELRPPASLTCLAALTFALLTVALLLIRRFGPAVQAFLFIAFALAGTTASLIEMREPSDKRVRSLLEDRVIDARLPVELTGVLERNPEFGWDAVFLTLRVEGIVVRGIPRAASGTVTLSSRVSEWAQDMNQLELRYGARIRVLTRLERTNRFRNPGVSSFTEYLDRKGYDATGFIKSPRLIERLNDDRVFLPLAWLYDWRQYLQTQFDSSFAAQTASVLDAGLLGNRHKLRNSTEEKFRDGGTFHVLVISGLHITFLGGLIFVVVRRLTRNKVTQYVASVAIVWGYSLAVGAEPSVLRAALMFTVAMMAPIVSRRSSALNGLGAVALALLLWQPSNLLDPSFQLTFISVLAILLLAWPILNHLSMVGTWKPTSETPYPPRCANWLRLFSESLFWSEREGSRQLRRANYKYKLIKSAAAVTLERWHLQPVLRFVFAAVIVSISVQVALLPFMVIYFHRLSLAAVLLNIFVSLGITGLAFAALAGVSVGQLSSVASEPFVGVANVVNWLIVHSVDPFARLGIASIRLPEYTGWSASIYAVYYIPLVFLCIWLARWNPLELQPSRIPDSRKVWLVVCAQLLGVALIVFHPFSAVINGGRLRVDFLDVGQGDSALVTLPDDTTILIDGGGRPGPFMDQANEHGEDETSGIGESVVSEYLWWRGLNRVDYLIATHADADHIDGLNDIARNFAVRAAIVGRVPEHDAEFAKLERTLRANNIPIRTVGAGDELQIGQVSINVLWPEPVADAQSPSRNNDSIVLQIKFGNRAILLTGDIETTAEKALAARFQNALTADISKVAHHGSRTSSGETFVQSANSCTAVISVGESSVFGHPHAEVVERWRASGADVLTTGHSGMISFITDGQDMQVMTFAKP